MIPVIVAIAYWIICGSPFGRTSTEETKRSKKTCKEDTSETQKNGSEKSHRRHTKSRRRRKLTQNELLYKIYCDQKKDKINIANQLMQESSKWMEQYDTMTQRVRNPHWIGVLTFLGTALWVADNSIRQWRLVEYERIRMISECYPEKDLVPIESIYPASRLAIKFRLRKLNTNNCLSDDCHHVYAWLYEDCLFP